MQVNRVKQKFIINNLKDSRPMITSSVGYFVFTLIYVLFTDSLWTYTWDNPLPYYIVNIAVAVFAMVSAILILLNAKDIAIKKLIIPILIYVGIILNIIVNKGISFGYIQKLSYPLIGLLLCITLDFNKLAKAFVQVMLFLAVWSIVLWIMAQFKLEEFLPIIKNVTGTEFHNAIFAFIPVHGDSLIRNWGVFWEPGAFQAYLCLAVIFDLFYLKDKKPIKMLILALAALLTFSTTGFLCIALILFVYLVAGNKKFTINKVTILLFGLVGLIVIFSSEKIMDMVFGKFDFDDINDSSSFGARYYSIIGNIVIMFKNGFLLGTGIEHYSEIYRSVVNGLGYFTDMSNTNTIFVDFARFGWLVGGVNVYLVFRFSKKLGDNLAQRIGIMLSIFMLLFMESFTYSLFWMSIMYFSFDIFDKEKKNENSLSM